MKIAAPRILLLTMLVLVWSAAPSSGQNVIKMGSSGEYAYSLFDNGDLQTMRINASGAGYYTARLALGADAEDMTLEGDLIYVALGDAGLALIELTSPDSPGLAVLLDDSAAEYVAAHGDTVYVGVDKTLTAFDLSNPGTPVTLGYRADNYYIRDLEVASSGRALVGNLHGLEAMSAPASDTLFALGTLPDYPAEVITPAGTQVYFASNQFESVVLAITDVSDPSSPSLLGDHSRPQGSGIYLNDRVYTGIVANGTALYISYDYTGEYDSDEYGIEVWNVANPASPTPVTTVTLDTSVTAMTLANGYLVAACRTDYHVYDLTDPLDPTEVSVMDVPEAGTAMLPRSPILVSAYPNPFNPSTTIRLELGSNRHLELAVYDLLGRKVTELNGGWMEAGLHRIRFDASGLASGVYFLRVTSDLGVGSTQRLVLVR